MPSESTRVTLQHVADYTGFSRSTISLALRGHPSLPAETRTRILQAAEKLSYRPNPLVAALMSDLRLGRRRHRETIALVSRQGQPISRREDRYYQILYGAIVREAGRLGLEIDEFEAGGAMSDARLSKVLKARGIHGVIFFPGLAATGRDYPDLDWSAFATVLIGFNTARMGLHQVVSDYAYDIDLALQIAQREGMRRIGFAITPDLDRTTNHNWQARYLLYQHAQPPANRVPIPALGGPRFNPENFLRWFRRHRPDTIIIAQETITRWLAQAGYDVPADVRLINLVQRGEPGLAGIDPLTQEVGEAAVSLLVSLLQGNEFGLPAFPRVVSIKGRWSEGRSFPLTTGPAPGLAAGRGESLH